ncbi:unnamed protein product, partial [Laminaria digitata]
MHDFCLTIPYGMIVMCGGIIGFLVAGSKASLMAGVHGIPEEVHEAWNLGSHSSMFCSCRVLLCGYVYVDLLLFHVDESSVGSTHIFALDSYCDNRAPDNLFILGLGEICRLYSHVCATAAVELQSFCFC